MDNESKLKEITKLWQNNKLTDVLKVTLMTGYRDVSKLNMQVTESSRFQLSASHEIPLIIINY